MPARTITKEDLAALKSAREAADAAYNAALSALDAAIPAQPSLPHPPPGPDDTQVTPLNERFDLLAGVEVPGGLKGRVVRLVWSVLQPVLARQQAFNAALVDHVNRSVPVQRATRDSAAATIDAVRIELEKLATFHSALIQYLQQLTPFVDSKDYEFDGLAVRRTEDIAEAVDTLHHRTVGPGGAISGVGDELNKRLEALATRERRFDARVSALNAAHEQLAQTLAVVSRATQTLKREVERIGDRGSGIGDRGSRIGDRGSGIGDRGSGPGRDGSPSHPPASPASRTPTRLEELIGPAAGPAFDPLEVSRGLAIGDLDNDGFPDVVLTNNGGPARVLRNTAATGNAWLGLDLRQPGPNRFAIGATVVLDAGPAAGALHRVRTDGSYLSASDARVIVGMGSHTAPVSVTVTWPDGTAQRFEGVRSDRYHTLSRE